MTANRTLMQMKYARIIALLARKAHISEAEAMDRFYRSRTYALISEGVSDMHCLGDSYLADEILLEPG